MPFLPVVVVVTINSPFQLFELYSLAEVQSTSLMGISNPRRLGLSPALPLPSSLNSSRYVAGRENGISFPVLACLRAQFHELVRGFLDAEAQIQRRLAPRKIGQTFPLLARSAFALRRPVKGPLIVRPSAGAHRILVPAGSAKRRNGCWCHRLGLGN